MTEQEERTETPEEATISPLATANKNTIEKDSLTTSLGSETVEFAPVSSPTTPENKSENTKDTSDAAPDEQKETRGSRNYNDEGGSRPHYSRAKKPYMSRRKLLHINQDKLTYSNVDLLSRFISKTGKILPRRYTKITAKMQRKVSKEIKRARHLGLLPYTTK